MNTFTKLSDKGQVVVPKAARVRLGWEPGLDLEVIETADGVTLRRRQAQKSLTVEQAVARFRELYQHQGPPVTPAEMKAAAQAMASGEDQIAE